MVYRVYVEKKKAFRNEADALAYNIKSFLKIKTLKDVRVLNCYDVEDISSRLFSTAVKTVFSEPQLDDIYYDLPCLTCGDFFVFSYEYLPGQFDQRADSAAQCIQLISKGDKPLVRSSFVIILEGKLTESQLNAIKKFVINPVECREAVISKPNTLKMKYPSPEDVKVLKGFNEKSQKELQEFIKDFGLAMDLDDISFCQQYFKKEKRDPSVTEIRVLDTYWSDHCRHTTFLTVINDAKFDNPAAERAYKRYLALREELGVKKPICLMDLATIGAKYLKSKGILKNLDESEEINACTVKIKVDVDGEMQDWLLLFKNETHNHPTEIEPFGGAATCIGGAIRDPLSGRSYVYQAMRVTGAGNPLVPVEDTLKGKLPQRKLVTTAANGYSSYGNQIGLATGLVEEIYHEGYVAKRMEIGAVVGAAPAKNVRRETPSAGDKIILIGGRTGRDGCGGATGSSKSHDISSIETCGAEVQKGNAPEERKLQRLFRNPEVTRLIKRCNDFGAGGVSVAIGELADGLKIDLDKVPKKYDGLDGTELAISESQERMAVVVASEDADAFIKLSNEENLEATVVAEVQAEPRLEMTWRGKKIVNISREFLNSNGAPKFAKADVQRSKTAFKIKFKDLSQALRLLADDLNFCSQRGLSERFDSTIGAGSVLMPFGGKRQMTPVQAMAAKIPLVSGFTNTCSVMSYGFNPFVSEKSPYHGAYLAVFDSVAKMIAAGGTTKTAYFTFQEYFERLGTNPKRWGKPMSALLGALDAQLDLGIGSIGGKDSMSGSFESLDVPPTLVSFAICTADARDIISPEFKKADKKVVLLESTVNEFGVPDAESFKQTIAEVEGLIKAKKVVSAYAVGKGGVAGAVFKMCLGNGIGFLFDSKKVCDLQADKYGAFVLELADGIDESQVQGGVLLGATTSDYIIACEKEKVDLVEIESIYENKLESVFPVKTTDKGAVKEASFVAYKKPRAGIRVAEPRVLIPVFPGTNCEYDTARAFKEAGADPHIVVIKNRSSKDIENSVAEFLKTAGNSQIIFIPGGFSAGDEPEGSGKFITAFFRNPEIKDVVNRFLDRDGLIGGICNGFQALIKLGLVPYGRILDTDPESPTLTYNRIGRHQSRIIRARVASNMSPWLMDAEVGEVYNIAISHGEGRFVCPEKMLSELVSNGQIATQYVGEDGRLSMEISDNPNGSVMSVEGITSPDGRVFGRMAHNERGGADIFKNVPGNYDKVIFKGAVKYFK